MYGDGRPRRYGGSEKGTGLGEFSAIFEALEQSLENWLVCILLSFVDLMISALVGIVLSGCTYTFVGRSEKSGSP